MPYLPDLSSPKVREIANSSSVALLPIGAIEQHGPHLPLSTDALVAEAIGRAVEDGNQDLWRLPTLVYSKSNEHLNFPGTITLTSETLLRVLDEVAASVGRAGFSRLAFLNAHGGNTALLAVAARDIRVRHGLMVAAFNPLAVAFGKDRGTDVDLDEIRYGIHAGRLETSVMLHLRPDLVNVEAATGEVRKLPEGLGFAGPQSVAWLSSDLAGDGVLGSPSGANSEEGRVYFEEAVRLTGEALLEFSSLEFGGSDGVRK